MSCPNTITIDGIDYVKEGQKITGNRHIVVLDRGWIFVGNLEVDGETYKLTNTQNIRKWGKSGFGGMVLDPKKAEVVLDKSGPLEFKSPIFLVSVPENWGE